MNTTRTIYTAILKPLRPVLWTELLGDMDGRRYKALCGATIVGRRRDELCPGTLGIVQRYYRRNQGCRDVYFSRSDAGESRPVDGDWYVRNEKGFRAGEDGVYIVIDTTGTNLVGEKVGRKQLPPALQPGLPKKSKRGIIGRFPILPARIRCPHCKRYNQIDPPSGAELH